MGQQQLLLIVLGVIIVGIAVVVGINVFTSQAQSSNRDLVVSQLLNYASKAQQYYRKPGSLGGGGNSFDGFLLAPNEATVSGLGTFNVANSTPSGATQVTAMSSALSGSGATIYIEGSGTETGLDGTNPVKTYCTVTADSIGVVQTPLN